MSENLFEIQALAQNVMLGMAVVVLVLIVVTLVYWFITGILLWRKEKVQNRERKFKESNRREVENLRMQSFDAEDESRNELLNKIKDIEKNEELELEIYKEKVEKFDKGIKIVDSTKIIQYLCGAILFVLFYIILFISLFRGTSTSDLIKLDYVEQDVQLTAYYVVDYRSVEQNTLTVFVKNNSEKTLESAVVKQKGTNYYNVVNNIEPGEEKIVSINSYDNRDYEFVIENVNFQQ